MANRIIYQSEALYVGPSPATGFHITTGSAAIKVAGPTGDSLVKQLQRIQTANYSFNIDRTDVNQFGQLAAIDRVILTSPTVSLDFSYLSSNLANENNLGLSIQTGTGEVAALKNILQKTSDEKNYFIRTVSEGNDAVLFNTTGVADNGVIGIGNGFVTSYSTEASVGNFPTTTINVEGLNMNFQKGSNGNTIPAVNPVDGSNISGTYYILPQATKSVGTTNSSISALRPGDITLSLPATFGADSANLNIQSYTLSFDLARTPLERLGSKFAFAREIDFPVTVNLSVEAQMTDLTTGNLAVLVNDDSATYTPTITIKNGLENVVKYTLKNCKLDSQEFSSDIGSNKSVTLNYSAQIGGPQDTDNGLFISGQY